MKRIEEEENGADADYCAKDERVPSLTQVEPLDEAVDGWESVWRSHKVKEQYKYFDF